MIYLLLFKLNNDMSKKVTKLNEPNFAILCYPINCSKEEGDLIIPIIEELLQEDTLVFLNKFKTKRKIQWKKYEVSLNLYSAIADMNDWVIGLNQECQKWKKSFKKNLSIIRN